VIVLLNAKQKLLKLTTNDSPSVISRLHDLQSAVYREKDSEETSLH